MAFPIRPDPSDPTGRLRKLYQVESGWRQQARQEFDYKKLNRLAHETLEAIEMVKQNAPAELEPETLAYLQQTHTHMQDYLKQKQPSLSQDILPYYQTLQKQTAKIDQMIIGYLGGEKIEDRPAETAAVPARAHTIKELPKIWSLPPRSPKELKERIQITHKTIEAFSQKEVRPSDITNLKKVYTSIRAMKKHLTPKWQETHRALVLDIDHLEEVVNRSIGSMMGIQLHREEEQTPAVLIEREYAFVDQPSILRKRAWSFFAQAALHPENEKFYKHWGIKFLEKAAKIYLEKDQLEEMIQLHEEMCKLRLTTGDSPIDALSSALEASQKIPHALLKEVNLGVGLANIDGALVKGGSLRAKRVTIDGEEKIMLNLVLTSYGSNEIRKKMKAFQSPKGQKALKNLGRDVRVEEGPFLYHKYDPDKKELSKQGAMSLGTGLRIIFPNVGVVELGEDGIKGTLSEALRITLEPGVSRDKMHDMLIMVGLAPLLSESVDSSEMKLKIQTVLHAFHPRLGVKVRSQLDEEKYFSYSNEELLDFLENQQPGVKADILSKIDQLEKYEISPGVYGYRLVGLEKEVRDLGGRGFFVGIGGAEKPSQALPLDKAATVISSIMQSGLFSSQSRYEFGLVSLGASVQEDFQRKGADSVFSRIVTRSSLEEKIPFSEVVLSGNFQLTISLSAVDRLPYCHPTDNYGCRNPSDPFYGSTCNVRPNILEHTIANERSWEDNNEVMFRGHLPNSSIKRISYQDPRKILVALLEQIQPNFFSDKNIRNETAKRDYLSTHEAEVTATLKDTHLHHRPIKEYWCRDPKTILLEKFNEAGLVQMGQINGVPIDDFIQEHDTMNPELFDNCYS